MNKKISRSQLSYQLIRAITVVTAIRIGIILANIRVNGFSVYSLIPLACTIPLFIISLATVLKVQRLVNDIFNDILNAYNIMVHIHRERFNVISNEPYAESKIEFFTNELKEFYDLILYFKDPALECPGVSRKMRKEINDIYKKAKMLTEKRAPIKYY